MRQRGTQLPKPQRPIVAPYHQCILAVEVVDAGGRRTEGLFALDYPDEDGFVFDVLDYFDLEVSELGRRGNRNRRSYAL